MIDWTFEIVSWILFVIVIFIVQMAWEYRKRKQWEERRRTFIQGYNTAKQEIEEKKENNKKDEA